jgi:glucose-1-phosphate thymidylyltransferase
MLTSAAARGAVLPLAAPARGYSWRTGVKVIIPAAGLGTRLRPHTHHRPKPLVTVAGDTVLGHVMSKLLVLDIDELVFIVGHLGDQIEAYVKERYAVPAHFVRQEELLGQAHALSLAGRFLEGPVLIVFVDTLFEAKLEPLARTTADGVVFTHPVDDPRRFGVVTLDDRGYVTRFVEKPAEPISNLAVVGLYFVRDGAALREAIEDLMNEGRKTKGEYYLADALQVMVEQGARLEAWPVSMWEDCGTAPALLRTNRYLLERIEHQVPDELAEGNVFVPPVRVEPGAEIEQSVVGPFAYVGDGCRVLRSIVGPHVSLAAQARICEASLRDCIVDARAVVANAGLAGSLVGADAAVRGSFERLNVGDHSTIELAPLD